MKVYLVDTNIFLRFLVEDNPEQVEKINQLFALAQKKAVNLVTTTFVINEVVWTLKSFYRLDKQAVIAKAELIINFPGIKVKDYFNLREAIGIYKDKNVDLVDIFTFQAAVKFGAKILSYDRDFDKLDSNIRGEP